MLRVFPQFFRRPLVVCGLVQSPRFAVPEQQAGDSVEFLTRRQIDERLGALPLRFGVDRRHERLGQPIPKYPGGVFEAGRMNQAGVLSVHGDVVVTQALSEFAHVVNVHELRARVAEYAVVRFGFLLEILKVKPDVLVRHRRRDDDPGAGVEHRPQKLHEMEMPEMVCGECHLVTLGRLLPRIDGSGTGVQTENIDLRFPP